MVTGQWPPAEESLLRFRAESEKGPRSGFSDLASAYGAPGEAATRDWIFRGAVVYPAGVPVQNAGVGIAAMRKGAPKASRGEAKTTKVRLRLGPY